MAVPRFRMFAGPNGSGKTHLFTYLKEKDYIHTEIYVNSDRIEKEIKEKKVFNFNAYRVKVSDRDFKNHILTDTLYEEKINNRNFIQKLQIKGGILQIHLEKEQINSYHASFIAGYLALKLFDSQQSFCFETVMSHPSKIALLQMKMSSMVNSFSLADMLQKEVRRCWYAAGLMCVGVPTTRLKKMPPASTGNIGGVLKNHFLLSMLLVCQHT